MSTRADARFAAVSGTHKVGGKDEPYVSNKAGLNRYTWDFAVDGPVLWKAGNFFLKGPETGPGVPPGNYAVRMTLGGKTSVRRFKVEPDPRSEFTQADYQRSFDTAMGQMALLSQVDTMLNDLDDLKKSMDTATGDAKKANNTALTTKLEDAAKARQTLYDSLAVNVRGEGTMDETKLHEDLLGAYFNAQGLVTPPVLDFIGRVDVLYRNGVSQYNAFISGVLPGVNDALHQAGMKPLTTIKQVTPR